MELQVSQLHDSHCVVETIHNYAYGMQDMPACVCVHARSLSTFKGVTLRNHFQGPLIQTFWQSHHTDAAKKKQMALK